MENMISARRLRKSMLNDSNSKINIDDLLISNYEIKRKIKDHEKENYINKEDNTDEKKFKFKKKVFFKFFISVNIVFLCLVCKLIFKQQIITNKYVKNIIDEYNKDYTKIGVLEKIENLSKKTYEMAKYVIPENVANNICSNYLKYIKPNIVEFCLKDEVLSFINSNQIIIDKTKNENIVNQENISNENNDIVIEGVGGGGPYEEAKLEEVVSAVSSMDIDSKEILSKNINIIVPVTGTITSRYGVRDQIFDNVNPYHTGIDIANKTNTKIVSATDGIVTKTEEMNKYYGNNIEIENEGVIFKYAHLNKIQVKKGDKVNQGDTIGLMGSTGMSTGSHLHFEIKINNRTVDPEKILKFN